MENLPLVSVIITTRNEEKNISNCLKSLKKQKYPQNKIEIVVVDNKSKDNTKKIARRYTDNVFDKGNERSAQRNFGAKKCRGKYFLYLDADMILHEEVIGELVDKMENDSSIAGLYIPEIVIANKFWTKVRAFERSFYNQTVVDCVRFVRLEDFWKVGGFDEEISGPEDWDFDKKIRLVGKVDIINALIYHNEGDFNLKDYLHKKAYYAKSFDRYITKWGKDDPDIRKQFGFYYRYFGVFIENGKWRKIILHPFLTSGLFFLRVLIGFKYITRASALTLTAPTKERKIYFPFVSIIIPTRQSEKVLDLCLNAIKKQNYPKNRYEVIVTDNCSIDRTIQIAKSYKAQVYNVNGQPSQGCAQRNLGAEKSKGEYLFFLDHDMEISPNLLRDFAVHVSRTNNLIDAWYVPERIMARNLFFTKIRTFERSFYNGTIIDAARIIKKQKYRLIKGGYDIGLSDGPADWDMDIQLKNEGFLFGIISEPIIHHEENLTVKDYILKKTKYTKGISKYIKKWSSDPLILDEVIKKQFGLYYRIIIVFIEDGKWKKLLRQIYLYPFVIAIKGMIFLLFTFSRKKI